MKLTAKNIALAVAISVSCAPRIAQSFNAADEFSATNNPTGVWRYGFESSLGGSFTLYDAPTKLGVIDSWSESSVGGLPDVTHNGTNSVAFASATAVYQPNQLALHPGLSGQFSILRFTAPSAGDYQISATFSGIDTQTTTTDVHVLLDSSSIFDSSVNLDGHGNSVSFSTMVSLAVGDSIDFAVGIGDDGSPGFDTTALAATIVPEPATLSFLFTGSSLLGALMFIHRRRA